MRGMLLKGCLEVQAVRDTYVGTSDIIIPAKSIGYVVRAREAEYLIQWNPLDRQKYALFGGKNGSHRVLGCHPKKDVIPTGFRRK